LVGDHLGLRACARHGNWYVGAELKVPIGLRNFRDAATLSQPNLPRTNFAENYGVAVNLRRGSSNGARATPRSVIMAVM
jgi:hypothetical protein